MRRRLWIRPCALAFAVVALSAVDVRAQPVDAQVVDSPPLGAGVVMTLRLTDHATGAPIAGARIQAARLFGSTGAALTATPLAEVAFGVYAIRLDLSTPGSWTLQATVVTPDLEASVVSVALTARAVASPATQSEPQGPARPATAQPSTPSAVAPPVEPPSN